MGGSERNNVASRPSSLLSWAGSSGATVGMSGPPPMASTPPLSAPLDPTQYNTPSRHHPPPPPPNAILSQSSFYTFLLGNIENKLNPSSRLHVTLLHANVDVSVPLVMAKTSPISSSVFSSSAMPVLHVWPLGSAASNVLPQILFWSSNHVNR